MLLYMYKYRCINVQFLKTILPQVITMSLQGCSCLAMSVLQLVACCSVAFCMMA